VTVNSDDPAYFGGYIADNFAAADLGLDRVSQVQLARHSFTARSSPGRQGAESRRRRRYGNGAHPRPHGDVGGFGRRAPDPRRENRAGTVAPGPTAHHTRRGGPSMTLQDTADPEYNPYDTFVDVVGGDAETPIPTS